MRSLGKSLLRVLDHLPLDSVHIKKISVSNLVQGVVANGSTLQGTLGSYKV